MKDSSSVYNRIGLGVLRQGFSLSLGLWRGEGREEKVLRATFLGSCVLTSKKGDLRPRRHSGRKADHYISRHLSRREESYLSLIPLPGQGRERKWTADGSRGHYLATIEQK
ncbi:hypothetical protein HAX54_047229, partial [Datura stramonium]|nr:hypothetical protein [Datura stramonium]